MTNPGEVKNPKAQQLVEHIKAAIERASAGHMADVLAGDDDMRRTIEARNVAAMLWPLLKDRTDQFDVLFVGKGELPS